jgi:predicted DsbA family dithiol-disulfide isomerase
LAEFPLKKAIAGKDIRVEWMPFELRPEPVPTLRPDSDYLQTAWTKSVYPMAERLGVEMHLPTVSPQPHTRLAHEGMLFARKHGGDDKANAYNDAVFRAFFVNSEDIGDLNVLARIAEKVGLNPAEFRRSLDSGEYTEVHRYLLQHATREMRVEGVPMIVVGTQVLRGLYPEEVIAAVVDEELAKEKH